MIRETLTKDGWVLQESTKPDVVAMMEWFPAADDVNIWGGPNFRFPFNRHSFFEDVKWGRMLSYSLRDPLGDFAAFGQLYERRENIPAFECYKSMGFVVSDYPDDMPHPDVCYYLTRRKK